jgi:hypothetical protein
MSPSAVFALLACVCVAASGFTLPHSDSCKYQAYFFGEREFETKNCKTYHLFEIFLTTVL